MHEAVYIDGRDIAGREPFLRLRGPSSPACCRTPGGLTAALTAIPALGLLAPLAFSFAARSYEADMKRAGELIDEPASTP